MLALVEQGKIDEHADRLNARAHSFTLNLQEEVDVILDQMTSEIVSSVNVNRGIVENSPETATSILAIGSMLNRVLQESQYDDIVLSFISSFSDQIDEFGEFYKTMSRIRRVPPLSFSEENKEVLANQAAAAAAAIYSQQVLVSIELNRLLGRSTNGVNLSSLLKGISTIVRKLDKVEQIARDHLMLWFRLVGSLAYIYAEENNKSLMYSYVGQSSQDSRDFCKSRVGRSFSKKEIDSMDNGQVPGVLHNGGGYGCMHWWCLA